eukprot:1472647-Pleurochrysis_carterae.AAC.1
MQTWMFCDVQRMGPTEGPSHGPYVKSVTWALHKVHQKGIAKDPSDGACAKPSIRMDPAQGPWHGPSVLWPAACCNKAVTR